MMDSVLSMETPPNGFPHPPPPDISSPTPPSHSQPSLPTLLVPKSEPFWDTHDDISDELDIFSEFNRVSELFNIAFGGTNTVLPQDLFGAVNAASSDPSAIPLDPSTIPPDLHSVVPPNSSSGDVSRAIVPVPAEEGTVAVPAAEGTVAVPRRKQSRQKELVRVTDLSAGDEVQFREMVRRTRLVYDSLRVLTAVEEEKRAAAAAAADAVMPEEGNAPVEGNAQVEGKAPVEGMAPVEGKAPEEGIAQVDGKAQVDGIAPVEEKAPVEGKVRRLRGDLRAAGLMRERGLWLNRDKRIVGAIPGIVVGDLFLFRMELCVVGLHGQIQAGIDYLAASMSATGEPIATSVIVSGGYEDDMDDGEVIVYTGHGGQEKNSSKQIADQKLEAGNLALERSMYYGIEVRVIRGMKYEGSASASGKVYVYDGLYKIVSSWFDVGRSGFGVFKFKLWRIEGQARMGSVLLKEARNIKKSGLNFNPECCLSADMSNKKENVVVRLFNDIDDNRGPLCYEYLARTSFPQFVFHQSGKATGCECVDRCGDGCFCARKNGGEFPYTLQGHLVRGKPLIFECGPFCTCPPHCRNRVAQKGLKNRLEVFRSQQTAWGVRSLDLIQAGAFICEFAGVVLTREQAQLLTMNGDSLIYPNRFSERWAEWGDLSQIYPDYVRPSYPSIPPLDFSLDVSTMRNVACYMSHSSTPNVLVQFVLYDHNNLMFPHLMLFAMENIPPMRELSLDYGVADEWTGKLSICN